MPRRPAGIPAETLAQRFARRVEEEAARREMSDAGLAKRASDTYPMSASTIWKIKNADPPRRVDIDEATAIAVGAFGYSSIETFLADSPLEPLRLRLRALSRRADLVNDEIETAGEVFGDLVSLLDDPAVRKALATGREEDVSALIKWADASNSWMQKAAEFTATVAEAFQHVPQMIRKAAQDGQ